MSFFKKINIHLYTHTFSNYKINYNFSKIDFRLGKSNECSNFIWSREVRQNKPDIILEEKDWKKAVIIDISTFLTQSKEKKKIHWLEFPTDSTMGNQEHP